MKCRSFKVLVFCPEKDSDKEVWKCKVCRKGFENASDKIVQCEYCNDYYCSKCLGFCFRTDGSLLSISFTPCIIMFFSLIVLSLISDTFLFTVSSIT
jgi:hypothetical protein